MMTLRQDIANRWTHWIRYRRPECRRPEPRVVLAPGVFSLGVSLPLTVSTLPISNESFSFGWGWSRPVTKTSAVSVHRALECDSSPSSFGTSPSDAHHPQQLDMYRVNLASPCHLGYMMYLSNAPCDATASCNEYHSVVFIFDAMATATIQAVYPWTNGFIELITRVAREFVGNARMRAHEETHSFHSDENKDEEAMMKG